MTSTPTLDLYTGPNLTEPAALWRQLLNHPQRVHHIDELNLWLLARYDDVRAALADNITYSSTATLAPVYDMCPEALTILAKIDAPPTTAAADPPVHSRTRRALQATFPNTAARVLDAFGAIVERRVGEAVERVAAYPSGAVVDLVPALTTVVPLHVIADILAIPDDDIPQVKTWSDGQIALVWGRPDPAEQVRLAHGLLDFWCYCQQHVRAIHEDGGWRAAGPVNGGDDFVSRALRYRAGDNTVLTINEVASLAFNLAVAGHETTAGLLAHTIDHALTKPTRWETLTAYPAAIGDFVEETLRYQPPIDGWLRLTTRDVTIGEVTIPAGARVLLLLGAAGHDRTVHKHPDRFDMHRGETAGKHLAFGYGPHYCIGAALARMEARATLTQLTTRLPGLRVAAGYRRAFQPNLAFRAHTSLPVVRP